MKYKNHLLCLTVAVSATLQTFAKTEITFLSDRIVHVEKHVTGNTGHGTGGIRRYPVVKMTAQESAKNPLVVVTEDANGNLTFAKKDGTVLLREVSGMRSSQLWRLDADEAIYGLGIIQDERLDRRNKRLRMEQQNREDYIPFFQSSKGYGVYWDNASPTTYEDNENGLSFASDSGDKIDYYFLLGDTPEGVIREMRNLTGHVPLMPKWTYGYWISRERYKSWDELIGVLDKHRELGIPLDGIVQDWQYWGDDAHWNAMEFLAPGFTNRTLKSVTDEVHAKGAHMMITIWPGFGRDAAIRKEFDEKGWLLKGFTTWPKKFDAKCYDVYNPAARDFYWSKLKAAFFDNGMDAWWMDSTEPDDCHFTDQDYNAPTFLGPWRDNRNAFPLATVEGVYDHQRAETDAKRVTIMTRSVFAGQQRTGANTWSGDVKSEWTMLRRQIPAGLGFTMCGNPNFNSDAGGFFVKAYRNGKEHPAHDNPRFRELYVRWMQFAVFNPLMRSHGTDTPREYWYYGKAGEPIYDALVKANRFRYRLLPYTYSLAGNMMLNDGSFMRALCFDFPEDANCKTSAKEFMYGPSLLVAPIAHAQYTDEKVACNDDFPSVDWDEKKTTQVYLPAGADWWEFDKCCQCGNVANTNVANDQLALEIGTGNTGNIGNILKGGQTIAFTGSLGDFPLYVRAGSILPLGDDTVQFAAEQTGKPIDLIVYPGADGAFDFYDDAGDGYGYERGEYCLLPMRWDDTSRTLTLGEQRGTFPVSYTFNVRAANGGETKTVIYTGKVVSIAL